MEIAIYPLPATKGVLLSWSSPPLTITGWGDAEGVDIFDTGDEFQFKRTWE